MDSSNPAPGLATDGADKPGATNGAQGGKGKGILQLPTVGGCKTEVLEQAGMTTQDASRAETVAAIDEGVFEQYAAKKKAQGQPVYVQQAIKDMTGENSLIMPTR